MIETAKFDTPIGSAVVAVRDGVVVACGVGDYDVVPRLRRRFPEEPIETGAEEAREAAAAVAAYLGGDLTAIDDVPVDLGGTPFQERVWAVLRAIPPGKTAGYAELARRVGKPRAARAVGAACGANPAWLIVPCHRAVAAGGGLGGYAGGLDRKRWLLDHERRHARP